MWLPICNFEVACGNFLHGQDLQIRLRKRVRLGLDDNVQAEPLVLLNFTLLRVARACLLLQNPSYSMEFAAGDDQTWLRVA